MFQSWMVRRTTRLFCLLLLPILLALLAPATLAHADEPIRTDLWVTDGRLLTMVASGNTLYVGGSFGYVGPNTGGGVALDSTSGAPLDSFPRVGGRVSAFVPDGGGGWYIGGDFLEVDGVARKNLAHILADHSVNPAWDPGADRQVLSLAVGPGGATVYAGGFFSAIGGQARNRIAALDTATGNATAWNPSANNAVRALAVSGDGATVYTGGHFTSIGGQARNRIAALDAATGAATAWNPNASSSVSALVVSGGTVYAGGWFSSIGGQSRNYIAALDAATGDATAWNPNASNGIGTLAVSGGTVYAGGWFTSIGGQARNHIAALDAAAGSATAWNPNAGAGVETVAVSGGTIYAGGRFTSIGGQERRYIAALDAATGDATAWDPNANDYVYDLAVSGDGATVYAGGSFASVGGLKRNSLAALDLTTGQATAWDPNAGERVYALAVSGDGATVYAGGSFGSVGGQARSHIAALSAATGNATTWDPSADGTVRALAVSGGTVYAGGWFSSIGGQDRNNIAALDAGTGLATVWDPNADSWVSALVVSGDTVYAGGRFRSIGGQDRNYIAALDAATGAATDWDPGASGGEVQALAVSADGATVYIGGDFLEVGDENRWYIAAVDAATGITTAWSAQAGDSVHALAVTDDAVYAGGRFTRIGGQRRNCIAALEVATGNATGWDPNAAGPDDPIVFSLLESGGTIYAGGSFASVGGQPAHFLAGLPLLGTVIIEKQTRPGGGSGFGFSQDMDGTGDLTLAHGQSHIFEDVVAGSYTVVMDDPLVTPGGYDLTGLVCVDSDEEGTASVADEDTRTATINLDPGETVTCTFTSTEWGKILVEKETEPGGDPTAFSFSGDLKASLKDGEREGKSVKAGTYTVRETVPSGWALMDITCSDDDSTCNVGTATATFQVKPGEKVLCTFANVRQGTITVEKQTDPDGSEQAFTFAGSIEAQLMDGQRATEKVAPGSHSLWEAVPAGWQLTSIVCDDSDSQGDTGTGVVTYRVKPGEDVTCTFTNTQDEPEPVNYMGYLPLVVRALP